ncbi:unnamed protein product [Kluyveromyces dobzhanskii CBS 2104]|uniref:Serine/threonine-protein kinase STE11 n=1 Tax=Kluyveromyces dobzhanskii CBS 2104 TaxID=1427455 RepID=A0A0A8LAJ9_9SACH|nr:unnamed protein product [Kluyveromyces dobzhanskii CBS 2104]
MSSVVSNPVNTIPFIEKFLGEVECQEYLPAFEKFQLVEEARLYYLDREILDELGVKKIGDKVKLLKHSRKLRRDASGFNPKKELVEITAKINALNSNPLSINEELVTDKHSVIFVVNDGSAKKVNVNGCFNAHSIKKKLIKRLPAEFISIDPVTKEPTYSSQDYDVFVVDYVKNVLHLLYDVELVTICHSSDRLEKNRLIFVSKDQTPSEKAIFTSKKVYLKTLSVMQQMGSHPGPGRPLLSGPGTNALVIENRKDNIREIFTQRPPTELISTNLPEYFPHTDINRLKKTLRNSMRQSIRASMIRGKNGSLISMAGSNKIGDILVNQSQAVDRALLESIQNEGASNSNNGQAAKSRGSSFSGSDGSNASLTSLMKRASISSSNRISKSSAVPKSGSESNTVEHVDRIELYNTDTDTEGEDDDAEDTISLPTKVEAPKSWLKGARIGCGSFGSVYLGMNAETGELMAVKQVELKPTAVTAGVVSIADESKKANSPGGGTTAVKNTSQIHRKMIDALQHEMNILKELHHDNIVTYYGSSQEGGNLNIFLEYVPGGSVSSMLNNYGPFDEPLVKNFTRQILIGLTYLHKRNIIHRDIKGANILIDIKGGVKITDFGISKKLSPLNKQQNKRASLQGSVYWMAPEVVKQVVTTEKADIWSVGCVIVEMFTGKHPFPDFSQMQAIFKIGTNIIPEIPSWVSDEAKAFLFKSFELDYRIRPSSLELLQEPWLNTVL